MHSLRLWSCLAAIGLSIVSAGAEGALIETRHTCLIGGSGATQAPAECDNCTGLGDLYWLYTNTHISGNADPSSGSCGGTSKSWSGESCALSEFTANQMSGNQDVDLYTNGAKIQPDCSCADDTQNYNLHWDITVYREHEAEVTGAPTSNWVMQQKTSAIEVTTDNQHNEYTISKGGSSTLSLNVGNEYTLTTLKKALEISLSWNVEYSKETNWNNSFAHKHSDHGELGKFCAFFYRQERRDYPVRYREWTCNGAGSWVNSTAKRGFSAVEDSRTATTAEGLEAYEQNYNFLTQDSTTISGIP